MRQILFLVFILIFNTSAYGLSLALNWKPEPQFGGFYAAEAGKIYEKKGLSVQIIPGGSGTPTVQMVATGKADYAIVSADELLIARERGSDLVALFASYQTNPQGIMVHAERGLKSLADVFAQPGTLALQRGLPYAEYLFKKLGAPKAKVVPYLGGLGNFAQDKTYSQQCFVTSEPLTAAKMGLKVQTYLIAEVGYNPYTTVLVTKRSTVEKNREQVRQMVAAVREGWSAYLQNPAPTNKYMFALNPSMDEATFEKSAEAQKSLIETTETKSKGLGAMSQARWEQLGEQLQELKVLKKRPEATNVFVTL